MALLLTVPLKASSDVDIVKPLKNLLQSTYSGDNIEEYTDALNELARLRSNAIWKVHEKSSLEIIYSYYDQLASLGSKIPPQEVQVPFKWKDAFDKGSIFGGRRSLTVSSMEYERMCVLFNIAAMQSVVAAAQSPDTEESLKLAAKLLQQAAGIFDYLKANIMLAVHQDTTPDLHPDTLTALSQLMLAQAQEVIVYKCIRDEMKESMVAKVAAQCDELYTDTLRSLNKDHIKALWDRDWIPTVTAKQLGFRAMAQYYQSLVCHNNKAIGEEISRLQYALELWKSCGSTPTGALAEAGVRAARALAAAQKDNDFIYHERVPDARQLEPVPRAPVAKPLAPPEAFAAVAGRELFGALLPLGVAQALAAASARRAEMAGAELAALRDHTQMLNSVLASLNLPAAVELGAGSGLPESIRQKARAVREAGGLPALQKLLRELPELLQRNRDILDEAERLLQEEEQADAALRAQFGPRWTRTASAPLTAALTANAAKYRQIIDNAVRADRIVHDKLAAHQDSIELLSGAERDIDVPDAPAGAGASADAAAVLALRSLMEDVAALKLERAELEQQLKRAAARAGGRPRGARAARRRRRGRRPGRGAGRAVRRARPLPRAAGQPHGGHQVLQRPHAAAGGLPEQGVGLLLRAEDGEGGAAEGPDAGRRARRRSPRAAAAGGQRASGHGPPRGSAAPSAPLGLLRPRPRPRRRRRAALPRAVPRHAAAVRRRGAVPVLRHAHAGRLQPLRHHALPPLLPRPRRAPLPPLPAPALRRRLPAPAARLQPLPVAFSSCTPLPSPPLPSLCFPFFMDILISTR